MAVAESSPDAVFIHAGAVAVDGRGIVLPGPSGAGKSTFTHELVRRGASYFCDEFAVIGDGAQLWPLPSWLSMRLPGGDRFVDPASVGRVADAPVPVAVVALAEYEPGRDVAVERLAGGDAVLAVLEHSLSLRPHPATSMRRAREVAERAVVVRMRRGEVDVAIDHLLELAAGG
jgi:serine kinase of HPr protein (carbohydrate metabolism regulator)